MRQIFFFAILMMATALNAQDFEWVASFGGTGTDRSSGICVDSSGNVYTSGTFEGTVDFDPGAGTSNLTSAGLTDVFVQKMDASGNFLWAKSFEGTSQISNTQICLDDSANVYTTGYFGGTVDFDPGAGTSNLTSTGSFDIFVQKMDASGNFLWAKSIGGTGDDRAFSISTDGLGNVHINGYFSGTVDFDPGAGTSNLISAGGTDIYVQKMDASGNFLWAKSMGGIGTDRAYSIKLDASDNVHSVGYFEGTVDFDPGAGTSNLTSAGGKDVFVQKMDASGNLLWAKSFGSTGNDLAYAVSVDASGNIYTTECFEGTVDFDPGAGTSNLTSAGGFDAYVQKMDASGNFVWAKSFGGTGVDRAYSISTDGLGNVYTTGYFQGSIDFDPGAGTTILSSVGGNDIFVQKMDANGNFLWAKSYGSINNETGREIIVDGSANVYTTGGFQGTIDFNPGASTTNLTSNGAHDIFVQKLSQCFNTGTDVQAACDSYTWIDGVNYTSSNNTATFNITNGAANGCDSLVTLDLTINNVSDLTTSTSGTTITANNSGASYQWLDCDNSNATIPGETGQSYTAVANGNYAVELTENGCVDTSNCVAVATVGIIQNNFGDHFVSYPNPVNDQLTIDLGTVYQTLNVTILNLTGQEVKTQKETNVKKMVLDMSSLSAGVYSIRIQSEEDIKTIKAIKK